MLNHSLILLPSYISILYATLFYQLPYFNIKVISQPTFIFISNIRIIILIVSNIIYIVDKYSISINRIDLMFSNIPISLFVGIHLIIFGQLLNYLVFNKLTCKGVYYGIQYSTVKSKKLEEFPFTISHPQYIGGILTYIGVWLLIANRSYDFDLVLFTELIYVILCQLYLIITETILDRMYKLSIVI